MALVILKDGKSLKLGKQKMRYVEKFIESIQEDEHPLLNDLREGFEEIKKIREGKKKGGDIKELLKEIENEQK